MVDDLRLRIGIDRVGGLLLVVAVRPSSVMVFLLEGIDVIRVVYGILIEVKLAKLLSSLKGIG